MGTAAGGTICRRPTPPGTRFDAGWYAESARTLLEAGDYRGGAELYLVARKRAPSALERERLIEVQARIAQILSQQD